MPNDMSDVLELEIDSLNAAGDGVAGHGRQHITVPFTIPGERVRVQLGPRRGNSVTATVLEVLRPSSHRVPAKCAHFGPITELAHRSAEREGGCGGCVWQHIAYPEQLRLKTVVVDRAVRAASPNAPRAQPMLAATPTHSPWGFRDKVHFVFGAGSGRDALAMGHFARGSRRVVPIRECPVHDERRNAVAFALRDAYLRANIGAADSRSRTRSTLKSVAIRVARTTEEIMTTLVVTSDADKRVRVATRQATARGPAPTSLHVNIHPRSDAFIFGPKTRRVLGPERMREEVAGVSFLVSPTAFFQTNMGAAEVLVRLVMDAVPAGSHVLDLYAGAGLFALPLARAGNEVIAIEENPTAVADGEASRRLNRITEERCRFIARPVEQAMVRLRASASPSFGSRSGRPEHRRGARHVEVRKGFDVVVLDPPREGCDASVLQEVFGRLRPKVAVYVSCDLEALERDLKLVVRQGYNVTSVQPVDMFPHTAHIETVVVLTR